MGFGAAYNRARKEKKKFVEGGKSAQGLPPTESLGYQVGNIVNQVEKAVPSGALRKHAAQHNQPLTKPDASAIPSKPKYPVVSGDNDQVAAEGPQYPDAEIGGSPDNLAAGRPLDMVAVAQSGVSHEDVSRNAENLENARFYPSSGKGNAAGKKSYGAVKPSVPRTISAGKKYEVGNMDVTFDPSVPQEQREAFMQDPVRPSAQIARRGARRSSGRTLIRPDYSGKGDKGVRSFGDIMRKKLEMAEQKMDNRTDLVEQGDRRLDLAERGVDINEFNALGEANQRELEGQKLGEEISAAKYSNESNKRKAELEQEYINPETTPERKIEIRRALLALDRKAQPKYKLVTNKGTDERGFATSESILVDPETGRQFRVTGDGPDGQAQPYPGAENRTPNTLYTDPRSGRVGLWTGKGWIAVNG